MWGWQNPLIINNLLIQSWSLGFSFSINLENQDKGFMDVWRRRRERAVPKGRMWLFMLFYNLSVSLCWASSLLHTQFNHKLRRIIKVVTTGPETNEPQNKYFVLSQRKAPYNCDFWPDNIWLSILLPHWPLTFAFKVKHGSFYWNKWSSASSSVTLPQAAPGQ